MGETRSPYRNGKPKHATVERLIIDINLFSANYVPKAFYI